LKDIQIDFNIMPRPTENQRRHAIGMLQAGLTHNIVARHFGVHRKTIQSLLMR
jgi:transposase